MLILILLAPEVMCRQNHGVAVDYFAPGVMAFECMYGRVSNDDITIYTVETLHWQDKIRDQRSHTI